MSKNELTSILITDSMSDQDLFLVSKDDKFGFINNIGEVKIDFDFEGASSFNEGYARIFHNGKTGYIDSKGNLVIEPNFDRAGEFSNGLAAVEINGKYGYINTKGEVLIEPSFYKAEKFENGMALVMPEMLSTGSFINNQGEVLLDHFNFTTSKFREGLINCSDNQKWGFIDNTGETTIPFEYKFANEFSEGLAAVSPFKTIKDKDNKKQLLGFINSKNEEIIPPIYQGSDVKFSEGLCAIWDKGFGYIDQKGEIVIPYELELGNHFKEGFAVCKPKGGNGKYGFIDKEGKELVKPVFKFVESFQNGLASVSIGESFNDIKQGYINKKGDYIWEPS